MTSVSPMAKKPTKKQPSEEPRDSLLAVRCKASWKAWVESFAERERVTPTQLVDQGLAELARSRGFEPPPVR